MRAFILAAVVVLVVGPAFELADASQQDASAREAQTPQPVGPRFRSTTTMVTLNVTVSKGDRLITGLGPSTPRSTRMAFCDRSDCSTPLNALYVTLKHFGRAAVNAGDVRRQAIAVLSDGEDTSSLIAFDDVLAQARTTGVTIYAIALRSVAEHNRPAPFGTAAHRLQTLARETGARVFFASSARELVGVYASIAQELRAQYSLAYAAPGGALDGRFRRIRIRLPRHPDFRARARTGYAADPLRRSR